MAHHDVVPLGHVARERAGTEDLQVIRVGANGHHAHRCEVSSGTCLEPQPYSTIEAPEALMSTRLRPTIGP
jgi:hypothetical protein